MKNFMPNKVATMDNALEEKMQEAADAKKGKKAKKKGPPKNLAELKAMAKAKMLKG